MQIEFTSDVEHSSLRVFSDYAWEIGLVLAVSLISGVSSLSFE